MFEKQLPAGWFGCLFLVEIGLESLDILGLQEHHWKLVLRLAIACLRKTGNWCILAGCNILLATNCSCRRGWIPQMLQKDSHDVFQHKLLTWLCEFLHDIDIIFKVFLKI